MKEIDDALPQPRGDEPRDLRRDIRDELADHLSSAMEEEAAAGAAPERARAAALERFGDPAAVARRLWFDAIKEAAMKDRVVLWAAVALMVGSTLFSWMLYRESREFNRALLEQLKAPPPPASMEWTDTSIQVTREDGTPVAGASVWVSGKIYNSTDLETVNENTAADGKASVSLLRPGSHGFGVNVKGFENRGTMTVRPGPTYTHKVVFPEVPPLRRVEIVCDWPEDLKETSFAVTFSCTGEPVEGPTGKWDRPARSVLLSARGDLPQVIVDFKSAGNLRQVRLETADLPSIHIGEYSLQSMTIYERDDLSVYRELRNVQFDAMCSVLPAAVNTWRIPFPDEAILVMRQSLLGRSFAALDQAESALVAAKLKELKLNLEVTELPLADFTALLAAETGLNFHVATFRIAPGMPSNPRPRNVIRINGLQSAPVADLLRISLGAAGFRYDVRYGVAVIHNRLTLDLDGISCGEFTPQAQAAAAQLLGCKVDLDLEAVPLEDALELLGSMSKLPFALKGPPTREAVTLKGRQMPLPMALGLMADEAYGGNGSCWIDGAGMIYLGRQ